MHEEIIAICEEQLEELPEVSAEYSGVCQAFRDIMEAAEKAKDAGERMENRLF